MNRALVTGGAGFIGSHLVDALLAQGVEVTVLDDLSAGTTVNLADAQGVSLCCSDVANYDAVWECMRIAQPDVIFHNAASKKLVCDRDPGRDLAVNAGGTLNLLTAARDLGIPRFIHASTGSVYAGGQHQTEDAALGPVSYYGISKLAAEGYVRLFNRAGWLDATVLRYFHVYGPRQNSEPGRGGVVAIFCRQALAGQPLTIHGDGGQTRSFTYVQDVVRANLWAASQQRMAHDVYNCASGIRITIKELADRVLTWTGGGEIVYGNTLPGDIYDFDVSNERIAQAGFEDWTSFVDGIYFTLEWYRLQEMETQPGGMAA